MESIKLKNEKYWDAAGVFDHTRLKSQDVLNDEVSQATTSTTIAPAPIVTFDASAANMPLKGLTVGIEPIQSGSGDPSPENVRPISGWTGCNVINGHFPEISWTENKAIDASGTIVDSASDGKFSSLIPYSNTTVFDVLRSRNATYRVHGYDANGNWVTQLAVFGITTSTTQGQHVINYTADESIKYIRVSIGNANLVSLKYVGSAYPITFPASAGTVYGGTLDVVNKRLTVDRVLVTLDGSNSAGLTWGTDGADLASIRFDTSISPYLRMRFDSSLQSNYLIKVAPRSAQPWTIELAELEDAVTAPRMWLKIPSNVLSSKNLNGALAYFTEHPLQICYELASPIVYDLVDIPEILTLHGTNNIWTDCGNVTVTYGAYLETVKAHADNEDKTTRAMLAPVEEGSTASANYAIGDMLVFSGKLCKATATIASGDTLAIGTNLTSTTVENELKANYVLPASGIPKADLAADVQKSLDTANASLFLVNGTNTSQLFKFWWSLSDPEEGRYARLEKFFILLADSWAGKKYTLQYYKSSVSSSPIMTPVDDLEGKSAAQLCTDTTSPVEDWADNDPMTWYVRANALSLADGTMNILAIEGLDDDFDLTGETAPVWTFSMALWKKEWGLGDYKYKSWATTQLDEYYKPYAGDVDPNTNKKRIMTWRPTFPGSLTADGTKLTSGVGGKPYLFVGAATAITKARAMDAYEGLWNDADAIWVLDMWQLRHFNLENSGICEGCQSYDYSPTIAVAETGVTRVLLTTANAANYQVGSNVSIGTDRANNIRTILSKEDVEVAGTTYTALNLDGEAFDTETSQKVFTMPWNSGNTENLPGHKDGACYSLTAGQNPLRVQGVETMSGAYDIGLDPLYNVTNFANSKGDYAVFECRDSEKLAGSITADYEDTGISYAQMPKTWNYPKTFAETDKAVLFPAELGGSTSTYYKSGFYGAASAGVRCPWRCGRLGYGAVAGLACEGGSTALSYASWFGRPRLSGSGKKRGVWTA